jgi:DNA repair exonuclease SbcCD nuclease subunit
MSKILFIGDPHLKITKFDLSRKFLSWIDEIIKIEKPDLVVNLGDTFDTHSVIRSEVMSEFMKHVYSVLDACPYVYLVGNHDQYKPNDSKYHALSHLKNKIDRFTIVDEPSTIDDITYVPYIHDPNMFPKHTSRICVAHQTFKGADYGDIVTKDGIDANCIQGAEIIISGHIHKKQILHAGRVHVLYPGSPFSQSASDIDQIKGISIIDTETFNEKFIECPLPKWKSIDISVNESFNLSDAHSYLSSTLNIKDNWVIKFTGPKAEILGYLDSKLFKSILKDKNIKVKTKFTDKEKKTVKLNSISIDSIIEEYIDSVYSGGIDRAMLKLKAQEIHELAKASKTGII